MSRSQSWLSDVVMKRTVCPPRPPPRSLSDISWWHHASSWAACWKGRAAGTWPGRVPPCRGHPTSHHGSLGAQHLPFSPVFMLFSTHFSWFPLCCSSCHFTHPASFLISFFPICCLSPFHLCAFLSFYSVTFLTYFSFACLFLPGASRRGFLGSISFSAFSTRRIFLLFSLFNILPVCIFYRAFYLWWRTWPPPRQAATLTVPS